MNPFSFQRGFSALALAAAMAPFVFFALLFLMVLGVTTITFGPLILAFVAWMVLSRRAQREHKGEDVLEARIVREAAEEYPAEAYTPPVHFDLMLAAKQHIGRLRGAASAIEDARIARQFLSLADAADDVLTRVLKEPAKLGLARRYFSSYLPRSADLAEGYHRFARDGASDRRTKLLDVLFRLETAMKEQKAALVAPELARIDADLRILGDDLKGVKPSFTDPPAVLSDPIERIVRSAKAKKG